MGPLRMYTTSPSTDLARIQRRLTTTALFFLRDCVHYEPHIPRQSDEINDFDAQPRTAISQSQYRPAVASRIVC
jgi:hypothetical protein